MIVGIVTLFGMLFFGGSQEYFFVESLEKGVKEYILDKDSSKEILAGLKESKSTIDAFNKTREKRLKTLRTMNLDYAADTASFDAFFQQLADERKGFQKEMVDGRMKMVAKIEDSEWSNIITMSNESTEKRLEKEGQKKEKDVFKDLENTIRKVFPEKEKQTLAFAEAEKLKSGYANLLNEYTSYNSLQSELLKNKNTTAEQFSQQSVEVNKIRHTALLGLKDFHFKIKEIADEADWAKVMKAVNKILS